MKLLARIFIPKIEANQIELLKDSNKPFMLRADIPRGSIFVAVCSLPSLIDMLGFSGGGGVPAFCYLVNPEEAQTEEVLFMTAIPERAFEIPDEVVNQLRAEPLGVVQTMGMLLMCFCWRGSDLTTFMEGVRNGGAYIFDTQPYQVPAMLLTRNLLDLTKVGVDQASQRET